MNNSKTEKIGFIKKLFAGKVIVVLLFALLSCRASKPVENEYREFTDGIGRRVLLPQKVERAISLAPSLTEIIFAIGAGDKLVGVTTYCDFPEEAKRIEKVGDTIRPNLEKIVALKPQVVFVSTASQLEGFTKSLEQQGIKVFVSNPDSLEAIFVDIEKIGEIMNKKSEAEQLTAKLRERVRSVEKKTQNLPKPRVFVQIDKSLFTVGKGSFINDLIRKAGGVSVTENLETSYPKISKETALALNPEIIVLTDSYDNDEPNDVFRNSDAVKNGRVIKVNSDIFSRPGPRIVGALEQLAEKFSTYSKN